MGTPARNLIIENVATTLAGVTVANGYKTTVVTVSRVIKNWADVGGNEYPWVGFGFTREKIQQRPFGLMEMRLYGYVVGHVNSGTDAERSDELSDLQDDIIAVLSVDPTRGGNAISTTIGEFAEGETDEADANTMDSRGGSGTVLVPVSVFYERTVNAT